MSRGLGMTIDCPAEQLQVCSGSEDCLCAGEERQGTPVLFGSAAEVALRLQAFRSDAMAIARLRQSVADADSTALPGLDDDEVIEAAAALVERGRIRVVDCRPAKLLPLATLPAADSAAAASAAVTPSRLRPRDRQDEVELDWIEIQLVDGESKPLAGERYRIKLPDGSVRSGSLDKNGSARFDGIPGGQCEVGFPEIDGREWKLQ